MITPYIIIAGILGIGAFIANIVIKLKKKEKFEMQQLDIIRESGLPAVGKIISAEQVTHGHHTDIVYVRLTVEVTKDDETPYQLTAPKPSLKPPYDLFPFSKKDIVQVKVGALLSLRVHPSDSMRIAFELELERDGWVKPDTE